MRIASGVFVFFLLVPALAMAAEAYVFLEGGIGRSPDKSNSDEVEFGNEPGGSLAAGFGYRFALEDGWHLNTEAQIIAQIFPLHGRNDTGEETADGKYLGLVGLTANVWPEYALSDRWSLYVGGGLGPAGIRAFGSWAPTLLIIAGAGGRYRATETMSLDLGGRYYWTLPVHVDGARSTYDSFGPSFRLIAGFD